MAATPVARSVTGRVLALLSTFDADHPTRRLTDLAEHTGLPVSTTHRLVGELVAGHALTRRTDGRYEIGRRLWDLGLLAGVSRGLREVALPVMSDICSTTGENVHIAVREGLSALYVERLSGSRSVPVVSRAGSRLPLHATGVGKVLLAHAEPEIVTAALAAAARVTAYTVVDPARLRRQLAEVRRKGYAQTAEEMSLGTVSIAVPVTGRHDLVVAALGVVATSNRRDLHRLVPTLQVAARGISRALWPAISE